MKIENINQRKAGVILSYFSQGISILSSLIYTPIMLRLLGQSEYGLYQLVYSVVSYLGVLSFGFSSSYLRFYSRSKAKQDDELIARLNGMYLVIFILIMVICIICGNVMMINIENIFSTGLTANEYVIAKKLMFLMVLNLAFTFPNSVFDSIISAHEQFVFQKIIAILQSLLNPFIALPLLLSGYGTVGMACVTTALTLTRLALSIFFCIRKLHTRFSFQKFDIMLLKEMWIFTFFIFINMIVDQINWNVDKFLLGRLMGTIAVAVYGIGGQINSLYLQLSTSVSNIFAPRINWIVAQTNDNTELTKLFTKVGRIQFLILSLVLFVFIFLGRDFIRLWAGPGYENAYNVALILIGPVTIPLIQNLGIEIQRAKNMHKTRSVVYFTIAIVNVFLSIPFIRYWGTVGAAIGTAISLLVGNGLFMNWYYYKQIGLDILYFWREIIKFIPAIAVAAIIGGTMSRFKNITGIVSFLIYAVLYIMIFSVVIWCIGMNKEEKELIRKPFH